METQHNLPPFNVDTTVVPIDVDTRLAGERNRLIESWRSGAVSAEEAQYAILKIYWTTRASSNEVTRVYLLDGSMDFVQEAGIDPEVDGEIWEKSQRDFC